MAAGVAFVPPPGGENLSVLYLEFVKRRTARACALLRFGAGELHDLRPFRGFVLHEGRELRGDPGERQAAQLDEPRLDPRIVERNVDLVVELLDDLGRRAGG